MRRRDLLRLGAVAGLAAAVPSRLLAIGERTRVRLGSLRLPGLPPPPSFALERLAFELRLRTSANLSFDVATPGPLDAALFDTPFVHLWGDRDFPPLDEAAVRRLRRFLEFGGLLLADDGGGERSGFDRGLRREAARIFPEAPLVRLPDEHSIFRSFYLLRRLGGRTLVSPFLEGATLDDRTPILYCRNDLASAWARDESGAWRFACVPGGEPQRQAAFFLGVNAVLYALTVNYKQDQIHLPFILERMRR